MRRINRGAALCVTYDLLEVTGLPMRTTAGAVPSKAAPVE